MLLQNQENEEFEFHKYKNKLKYQQELEEELDDLDEELNKKEVKEPLTLQEVIVLYDKEKLIGIEPIEIYSIKEHENNNNQEEEEKEKEQQVRFFSKASVLLHIFKQNII